MTDDSDKRVHIEADCPKDSGCKYKIIVALVIIIVGAGAAVGGFVSALAAGGQ